MRQINLLSLIMTGLFCALAGAAEPPTSGPLELWYDAPAREWTDALPIGNGQLGAMIFGGVAEERLQLNEITVWSGQPAPEADRPDAWKALPEIRKLLREEKYKEAEKLVNANMTNQGGGFDGAYNGSYQTLGDLRFKFDGHGGKPEEYRRWLDVSRAVAGVRYKVGGETYTREIFASVPQRAIIMRLTSTRKGGVGFTMTLTRPGGTAARFETPNKLVMAGTATPGELKYEAQAGVIAKGGELTGTSGTLTLKGADEATVLLCAGTDYIQNYPLKYKGEDPHQAVSDALSAATAALGQFTFDEVRGMHVQDYNRLFGRVSFKLGRAANSDLATDERLRRFAKGEADPDLPALFFQYGRYLLIASCRPHSMLPPNLQGLWGDGLKLPWHCDYHMNINIQMNNWPIEPTNLSELHLPTYRLILSTIEPGARTMQSYFNSSGWMLAMTTNAWGWTSPGWSGSWGAWFLGGAWMCQTIWDHYAFTRNGSYLNMSSTVLIGASLGCLGMLTPDADGWMVTSPSTSPENRFKTPQGVVSWVSEGAAMDRQIIYDLFTNTMLSNRILGISDGVSEKLVVARERIRPPEIGKAGQLMEWAKDWDLEAPEPHHRHVSHLFALFPGRQISPLTSPTLANAARKSLELRGDEGTGWSIAWKINFWARLLDGDRAYKLLCTQLKPVGGKTIEYSKGGGTYHNLFDAHPPFQIDGNFGAVSGMTEMLLQSHEMYEGGPEVDNYVLHLLPALPKAWPEGAIKGLCARGGFEVDQEWSGGKLARAEIRNKINRKAACKVRYAGQVIDLALEGGKKAVLDGALKRVE